jgi:hypothetical protein
MVHIANMANSIFPTCHQGELSDICITFNFSPAILQKWTGDYYKPTMLVKVATTLLHLG